MKIRRPIQSVELNGENRITENMMVLDVTYLVAGGELLCCFGLIPQSRCNRTTACACHKAWPVGETVRRFVLDLGLE